MASLTVLALILLTTLPTPSMLVKMGSACDEVIIKLSIKPVTRGMSCEISHWQFYRRLTCTRRSHCMSSIDSSNGMMPAPISI
jgi:hypothetical protein